MIDGSWDTINWIGAGCILALILYSTLVTLELSHAKNRNYMFAVPFIMFVGMAGFIWVSGAPTHSYMEREFWQERLEYEASMELVEERVAEKIDQMTVDFGADIPVYCSRGYPHRLTESQKRHCYMLEIHRLMERYAVQTGANNE